MAEIEQFVSHRHRGNNKHIMIKSLVINVAITKMIDSKQGDNRNELTCCKEGKDRWRALEGGKLLPTWQLGLVIGVRRPAFFRRL